MERPVPVVVVGLGPIGRAFARIAARRPDLDLVGAVDVDPALVGRALAQVCGGRRPGGPEVVVTLSELPAAVRRRGGVVVHAAGSRLSAVEAQLAAAVAAGFRAVSSCEELCWPWDDHAAVARRLDRLARRAGVAVAGTGVNPGFVLDVLPAVLSTMSRDVRRVVGVRVVDAARRRLPLQRKVGAGLSVGRFRALARQGAVGHVGLVESARLVAAALGWPLDEVRQRLRPVVAEADRDGPIPVRAGQVLGQHQVASARSGRKERVRLELTMALGAADPHDRVELDGEPPFVARVDGGVAGDEATVAALVHGVFAVWNAPPGLHTPLDMKLPHGVGRDGRPRPRRDRG